jgi:hypothetical protein
MVTDYEVGIPTCFLPASERQIVDVGRACQCLTMTKRLLRGTEFRYVLSDHLAVHGPATVAELADMLASRGFETAGRASKAISDALRWEIGRGRVRRLRRGRYGPGWMPRSTEYRIHKRALALRAETEELALEVVVSCVGVQPDHAGGAALVQIDDVGTGP